jgi:hypothetical protein
LFLELREECQKRLSKNTTLINAGENIAALIGRADAKGSSLLRPIYIIAVK